MGEKDNGQPIFANGKEYTPGGFPELSGQFIILPSDNSKILEELVSLEDRMPKSHIEADGIMKALYVDDMIRYSSGYLTLSGKYEEALNEKICENKDAFVLHGTLGPYNINKYPWNMLGTNNWRKYHGFRMRRKKKCG